MEHRRGTVTFVTSISLCELNIARRAIGASTVMVRTRDALHPCSKFYTCLRSSLHLHWSMRRIEEPHHVLALSLRANNLRHICTNDGTCRGYNNVDMVLKGCLTEFSEHPKTPARVDQELVLVQLAIPLP